MSNNFVKNGYEKAADKYIKNRNPFESLKYLKVFTKLVEKGKTILDVGSGTGKPVDAYLVKQGYAVNGIDISERMVTLAKKNVPQAFYEVKDMSLLREGEYCVNGIISFYAIFQTPHEKHQDLLKTFASFMPNGGALLIATGAIDWEETDDNIHGAKMFWSYFGHEQNKELVEKAGFKIILNEIDNSLNEKHQIIIAKLD